MQAVDRPPGAVDYAAMRRRAFLNTLAAAPLAPAALAAAPSTPAQEKTWLFWDLWKLDTFTGAELRQGQARPRPEYVYEDPLLGSLSSWPSVSRDPESGKWRMYYGAAWRPLTLLAAESDDGLGWRPLASDVHTSAPAGQPKRAPHHLFTLPSGSGGSVYVDPDAADGYPYKLLAIQTNKIAKDRALASPEHPFHDLAKQTADAPRYFSDHLVIKSRDGRHWEADYAMVWNRPGWHPEPPVFGFHNAHTGRHAFTSRPGHGDRRVVLLDTADFREWSEPELLLQPDPLDQGLVEHYGMPVFPYAGAYVGLLWVFHINSTDRPSKYNRSLGWIDCQLAYSYDGRRFQRGPRRPFIPLSDPGEYGGGHLQPSAMAVVDDEIRIWSTAGKHTHGMGARMDEHGGRSGLAAITLHTLRKDGFFYLNSTGAWANVISKPLVLNRPGLTLNAAVPQGEILFQVTDVESRPITGFSFDECNAITDQDSTRLELTWSGSADRIVGKPVRLELRWLNGRVYALRGDWHFLDAQDWHLLEDGRSINPRWFDY